MYPSVGAVIIHSADPLAGPMEIARRQRELRRRLAQEELDNADELDEIADLERKVRRNRRQRGEGVGPAWS